MMVNIIKIIIGFLNDWALQIPAQGEENRETVSASIVQRTSI